MGHAALFTLGSQRSGAGVGHHTFHRLAKVGGLVVQAQIDVLLTPPGNGAIGHHIRHIANNVLVVGTRGQQVVPDHFLPVLGDGEVDRTKATLDSHAVVDDLRLQGILLQHCAHLIGVAEIAMPLVDRNLHGLGILLEHGFLTGTELVAILLHVLCSDHEQWFFIGIEIHGVLAAGLHMSHARRGADPFACELRNRAFLVAGLDGTHACQFLAQLFCLVRRHLRPYRCRHHQTHCRCEWSLGCHKLHLCLLGSRTYFWRVLQTRYIASHHPIGFAVCRQLHTASAGLFNHRLS
ncbi:hypothetical protein SDC9_143421 [bioreactor metagenome]|uniref:Uncharacterized protein n=1 Tax=bioreactor metagenome TaxID=1076179 RepID=A0A645E631_9ZZZZ